MTSLKFVQISFGENSDRCETLQRLKTPFLSFFLRKAFVGVWDIELSGAEITNGMNKSVKKFLQCLFLSAFPGKKKKELVCSNKIC